MTCRRSQAARTTAMAGGSFRDRHREPVYNRYVMRIDFLYWEDCPSHDEALRRLRAVLTEDEIAAEVQVTHVDTEELALAAPFGGEDPPGGPRGAGAGSGDELTGRNAAMTLATNQQFISFALPGVAGKTYSPEDFGEAKALAVIFWCNHCPYVRAWEDRVIALQHEFAGRGVRFVLINSNDPAKYPEDSFEQMQVRARLKAYPLPPPLSPRPRGGGGGRAPGRRGRAPP